MVYFKIGLCFEYGQPASPSNQPGNSGNQDAPTNNQEQPLAPDEQQEPQVPDDEQQEPQVPDDEQQEPQVPDEQQGPQGPDEQQGPEESDQQLLQNNLKASSSALGGNKTPVNLFREPSASTDHTVTGEKKASQEPSYSLNSTKAGAVNKANGSTTVPRDNCVPTKRFPVPEKRSHREDEAKMETGSSVGSKKPKLCNTANNARAAPSCPSVDKEDDSDGDSSVDTGPFFISKPEVSSSPTVEAINEKVRNESNYDVVNLTLTHSEHGSVQFVGTRSLEPLVESNNTDLAKLVCFVHGAFGVTDRIQAYPLLFTFQNITRKDFAQQWRKENVTDDQLVLILNTLEKLFHASHSNYDESSQIWTIMIDAADPSCDP